MTLEFRDGNYDWLMDYHGNRFEYYLYDQNPDTVDEVIGDVFENKGT